MIHTLALILTQPGGHTPNAQKRVFQVLFINQAHQLQIQLTFPSTPAAISVVPSYVYLGGVAGPRGGNDAEVSRRGNIAAGVTRDIRCNVLRSPLLDKADRVYFADSLSWSTLCCNAGTWGQLGKRAAQVFHTAYMPPLRIVGS